MLLVEWGVLARGESSLILRDFNVEATKIPCLCKGVSAGLWVDLEVAWALAQPAVTCKRTWDSTGGHRRDFIVGCTLAAAAVPSCRVEPGRWVTPRMAVWTHFDCGRWTCTATQPVQRAPLWWLAAVDKSWGSQSAEVQRVWEAHDDRLQKMTMPDLLRLDESLRVDVSRACLVWSAPQHGKTKKHPFFYRSAPAAPSACFFWVFSFRGPSARYSVFWCKIVAFILGVPSRALLPFWAEHAFLAFFRGW